MDKQEELLPQIAAESFQNTYDSVGAEVLQEYFDTHLPTPEQSLSLAKKVTHPLQFAICYLLGISPADINPWFSKVSHRKMQRWIEDCGLKEERQKMWRRLGRFAQRRVERVLYQTIDTGKTRLTEQVNQLLDHTEKQLAKPNLYPLQIRRLAETFREIQGLLESGVLVTDERKQDLN